MNNNGFTLLELLIAATIVSALAILATVSYQGSVSEAKVQAAKVRTEALAGAVQRFVIDGGNVNNTRQMTDINSTTCTSNYADNSTLIGCGYVRNGGWSDSYFYFYLCNGKAGACSASTVDAPLACMFSRSDQPKLTGKYKSPYNYCVSAVTKGEYFGS